MRSKSKLGHCRIQLRTPEATPPPAPARLSSKRARQSFQRTKPQQLRLPHRFSKRVDLAELSNQKISRHRQGAPLVGFQGDLLGQHDVTCYEIVFRYEAPARSRPASAV